jgi:hypothetical protein
MFSTSTPFRTSAGDEVLLLPPSLIRPHEKHDEALALALAAKIAREAVWTVPLVVEAQDFVLLDGHLRLRAAQLLDLASVPVVVMAYDDPRITLVPWRVKETWSREAVVEHARAGRLLPPKTTRHVLDPEIGRTAIPLRPLRRTVEACLAR